MFAHPGNAHTYFRFAASSSGSLPVTVSHLDSLAPPAQIVPVVVAGTPVPFRKQSHLSKGLTPGALYRCRTVPKPCDHARPKPNANLSTLTGRVPGSDSKRKAQR